MDMTTAPNGQKVRSMATQIALMEAAEDLIAERGMHKVSVKDIVREAGQKNTSVLQYHFINLEGLFAAIHKRRNEQTHAKRAEMLEQLETARSKLSLRDLCELMVYPSFELSKTDKQFRNYTAAFGHEIVLTKDSALNKVTKSGGGGESGARLGSLLRESLPHLDESTYRARMDLAVRMCSAAVSHHMREQKPMKGQSADFFVNNLIDSLEGLLSAKVSTTN